MGKPFKMKGHTLPGINQRSEGDTDLPDGRPASAALQYKSPAKEVDFNDPKVRANYEKFKDNPEYKKALATKMGGETTFTTGDEGAKSETKKSMAMYASPAKKPEDLLVGNRKNLPEHLQAKISAAPYKAPTKKYKKYKK